MSLDFHKTIADIAESIRKLKRGLAGQEIDAEKLDKLIDLNDPRQLARLSEHDYYGHSLMYVASHSYEELEVYKDIYAVEDAYSITINGEQRKEAILMTKAKSETQTSSALNIALPSVSTTPTEAPKPEQEKKKGLFRR